MAHGSVSSHSRSLAYLLLNEFLVILVLLSILHKKLSETRINILSFIRSEFLSFLVCRLGSVEHPLVLIL